MSTKDIPERVSSLEATMASLSRDVQATNANLMDLATTMESGFNNVREILTQQKDQTNAELKNQSKTNWPLLISLFGAIVTVCGWYVQTSTMDIRTDIAVIKYHLHINDQERASKSKGHGISDFIDVD